MAQSREMQRETVDFINFRKNSRKVGQTETSMQNSNSMHKIVKRIFPVIVKMSQQINKVRKLF